MKKIINYTIGTLSFLLAAQAIYFCGFGFLNPLVYRPLALGVGLLIVLANNPLSNRLGPKRARFKAFALSVDVMIVVIIVVAIWRYIALGEELEGGFFVLSSFDKYVALLILCVLMELTRRAFGLPLFIITGVCFAYAFLGKYLPGTFQNAGYSLETIVTDLWLSTFGVMGMPMAVVLNILLIFITFGVLLEATKAGDALMKISMAASGRFRGGAAHAAVISSALFGTMSGSPMANVVGTGTFTIPMSKKQGFPASFAAGVEASASTAGQILPPVMGAAAFLLAEYAGVSYLKVAIAALIPGLFFYISLFITVELKAARLGFKTNPDSVGLSGLTRTDWLKSLNFVIPIVAIIFILVSGRSPSRAGFWGVLSLLAIGLFNLNWKTYPKIIVAALTKAGKSCADILIAVGCVGILVAVLDTTGAGLKFAQFVLSFSGDSIFISLVITMFGCMILGMGMPTFPAYLIIVLVMGPVIVTLGVVPVAMHLFVFYYGVFSMITPPVAMASYAAATVAGSGPMETCIDAFKIGLIGFIIPFVFVYHPSILLIVEGFSFFDMLLSIVRLLLAFLMLNTAILGLGIFIGKLGLWERILRFVSGFGILIEFPALQIVFGFLAIFVIMLELVRKKVGRPVTEVA